MLVLHVSALLGLSMVIKVSFSMSVNGYGKKSQYQHG
jgi:hypothetical protein